VGERKGVYRSLVVKPEENRPFRTPRRRWDDNIKTHLQEVEWGAWTGLIWPRMTVGGLL